MGKLANKKYIDIDVYTAAKERIKNIINMFDSVLVCFSGGKDSLTTLCLVEEVYKELGIKEKIKVVFRDEELIPDDVIDFVTEKYKSGKYDFRYYAIPLKSSKFILGKTYDYIQWDKDREWVRQPPSFAIRQDKYQVFDQYTADSYICKDEKGKVAMLTGMRADESLIRFSSCVSKVDNNYINNTKDKRIKLCKPIYDWTERDIFLYFYKNNIKYCKIYDLQLFNRQNFRVSTPLHAESSKQFNKLRTLYPTFYQQIIDIFPEMLVQERYWKELNRDLSDIDRYPHSVAGIKQYIEDNIEDKHQKYLALLRVKRCMTNRTNKIKEGNIRNLGGYPLMYIFKAIINGQYKRNIMPRNKASLEEFLYEGYDEDFYKKVTGNEV